MFTPKYIHLRKYNDLGYPKPCGGATVAYLPANDDRSLYYASVARCRKDDRYVKAEGRRMATDRLYTGLRYLVRVDIYSHEPVSDQVMEELYKAGAFHFWKS